MHQAFDAFSDSRAFGNNVLTRADVRVKLGLALAAVSAVLLSGTAVLPTGVFVACAATSLALRVPGRVFLWRLAAPLSIAAVMVLMRACLSGGTPLVRLPLGLWEPTLSREGLAEGVLIGSRVLGSMSVLVLLGSVTPAYKVCGALRWARVPYSLVELAMLMYRYAFALMVQVSEIHCAQRVRLGYTGFRRSLSSLGGLMGVVVLRSLDQADRTHEAMVARGYRGILPTAAPRPLRASDLAVLLAGLAVLAAAYVLCQGGVP